ncbi:MAG: glycosyltransferase [Acidobacteriota bacterium]
MSDTAVSVILPVRNQADHIAQIVQSYETALDRIGKSYELLLIVNASGDRSASICRDLATGKPARKVLESAEGGWGRAVRLGFSGAAGDLVCYTNSARTRPEDLALLLFYAFAYPNTVVKANRKIRDSWVRRLGSLAYNLECRALFDLSNWDINGTPKVFPRTFDKLLSLTRDDDLIDLEFHVVCRREGYPVLEVPILSARRHGGRSTTNIGSAIRMYVGAYRLRRTFRDVDRA